MMLYLIETRAGIGRRGLTLFWLSEGAYV